MVDSDLPFPNLNISDVSFLDEITDKHNCSKCGKRRMYFCYTCFLPMEHVKDKLPSLKLPIKVDVIKHPGEVCGKSTAVHAAILAPEDVKIHIYPDIPDFDPLKTVLLYPCDESRSFKDYLAGKSNDNSATDGSMQMTIERVIFIDSTWFQAYKIFSDERLKEIPRLEIDSHDTKFWRYQLDKPTTYLSTIEAIYYCIREFDEATKQTSNANGNVARIESRDATPQNDESVSREEANGFDDLLFFFSFFYRKIRRTAVAEGRTLKSYTNQRRGKKKADKSC